ncbi:NADP-dependent oxidoreductase domain [Arabidopsis suecica]|uniref:NADP-dependent oxidoreductase domain n=1 Tax=Arabidopsis suecica TaxID=45249 RepID=A0A8T2HES5_ARASU|nr:NADP-dependent oxidoreductase domain [Arabidopsis suecica]
MSLTTVPTFAIRSGPSGHHSMPVLGFGTAASPLPEPTMLKETVIEAIKLGYRHFDTSPRYQTEEPIGEALAEAVSLGLVRSRSEFFVTTKLWCADAHGGLVVPAIKRSLKNLKLDYLDLYIIHWPVSSKPGKYKFPIDEDDFMPMDFEVVWSEMEECQRLGLAKCIGVSNFSCKKLQHILSIATIPPSVNQVEMSPIWQQRKLRELCRSNDIVVTAYSVLGSRGAFWGTPKIMESDVLKEIAEAKEKTVAQVSMRWAYEQGVSMVVKSFTKERLEENLKIFDWSLTEDETQRISTEIPQFRNVHGEVYTSKKGPIKSVAEMWDGEI